MANNGRPIDVEMNRAQPPRYFNQQERYDRIDREAGRIGNPQGPQAAKEPEAIPGYKERFDIRVLFANADQPQATLGPGIIAIRGQLVKREEPQLLDTSSVEWTSGAIPIQRYFVYINISGEVSVDARRPVPDSEAFAFVHPVHRYGARTRVALGQLFLDLRKRVIFGVPGLDDPNVITVASFGYIGQSTYYCRERSNQNEINAAALYLRLSRDGGVVQLSSGNFWLDESIILGGSQVSIQGDGNATNVYGRPAPPPREGTDPELDYWATEDVGNRTTSVVSLRAAPLQPDEPGPDVQDGTAINQVRSMRIWFDGINSPILHTAWGGDVSQGEGAYLSADIRLRVPELEVGQIIEELSAGREGMYSDGSRLDMRRADGREWQNTITLNTADENTYPSITVRDIFGNDRIIIEARGTGPFIRVIGANGTAEYHGDKIVGPDGSSWDFRGDIEIGGNITTERGNIEAAEGNIDAGQNLTVGNNATIRNALEVLMGSTIRGAAVFEDAVTADGNIKSEMDVESGRDTIVNGQVRWVGGFQWTRSPREAYRRLDLLLDIGETIGVNGVEYSSEGFTRFLMAATKESSTTVRVSAVQFNHRLGGWYPERGDNDLLLTASTTANVFFLSWYEIRGRNRPITGQGGEDNGNQ